MLVEPPPESLLVTVSAIGKALLRSDWKRRGARLQITDGRSGRFKQDIASDNVTLIDAQGEHLFEGEVRGKRLPVAVAEMPFNPTSYKR